MVIPQDTTRDIIISIYILYVYIKKLLGFLYMYTSPLHGWLFFFEVAIPLWLAAQQYLGWVGFILSFCFFLPIFSFTYKTNIPIVIRKNGSGLFWTWKACVSGAFAVFSPFFSQQLRSGDGGVLQSLQVGHVCFWLGLKGPEYVGPSLKQWG